MSWWGNYRRVIFEEPRGRGVGIDKLVVSAEAEGAPSTGHLRLVVRAVASLSVEPGGSPRSMVCKELFVPAAP